MGRHRREEQTITLGPLHEGQLKAHDFLKSSSYKVLRCGRRFGKTEYAKIWIASAALEGFPCAWFSPQHKLSTEVFTELLELLRPLVERASRNAGYIRLKNNGRIDFWTLEKFTAGRGRGYKRVVIDEAAFTKNGDSSVESSMMSILEKSIKPTLVDHGGQVLVCSNSAGKDPENFLFMICDNLKKYGFVEHHATTADNPILPKRREHETEADWQLRRAELMASLKHDNDPLVYAQEYEAQFVDWSGQAFFNPERLLENGKPVPFPVRCECVFAVIDTAAKTGTDNDSTAVTFFASDRYGRHTEFAYDKTTVHKQRSANHLKNQIESFRIGDKASRREDDLLDTFCYGISISLGNNEGF